MEDLHNRLSANYFVITLANEHIWVMGYNDDDIWDEYDVPIIISPPKQAKLLSKLKPIKKLRKL